MEVKVGATELRRWRKGTGVRNAGGPLKLGKAGKDLS